MKLIGNYLSPYARRVAISLNALEIPYTLEHLYVFKSPQEVRKHNPLVRIPALILDDGEVLVESYAILDAIDQIAGADRSLTPASGPERRHVMKLTALGVGAMEKAQWAFYEERFKPEPKVHRPWIEHNEKQVLGGLGHLDELAEKAGVDGWLAGSASLSQADITAAVAFSFTRVVRPMLGVAEKLPSLARFTDRCETMQIFRDAPIPESR